MSLAKAIIAELIDNDELPEINTCEILSSRLPSPYSGRSVEARQFLIQDGFIEKAKATNLDRITKEAIKYIKSSGDDYFKTAKIMLDRGIDAEDIADQDLLISEDLWDNPEKNRRVIQENISQKRSYGKKRSIQVKVSMSDEEVRLIDWLCKLGYGKEGSRSATLRQAISDIARLVNDQEEISDINNMIGEILSAKLDQGITKSIKSEVLLSRENGGCIFIIDSKSSIKEVIQLAIRQNHESYIFCVRDSQINLVSEIDQLLEGVAIAYNGQIIKSSDEFVSYKVIPSPSDGGGGGHI